jgi:hypothetical protein
MLYNCDGCGCKPIKTQRWQCDVCQDFDFCDACHNGKVLHDRHNHDHSMSAISLLDGCLKKRPGKGFQRASQELMKSDPHFNLNLWCSQQS